MMARRALQLLTIGLLSAAAPAVAADASVSAAGHHDGQYRVTIPGLK